MSVSGAGDSSSAPGTATFGDRLAALQSEWLPFYTDALRGERLDWCRDFCRQNLDYVPWLVGRELYFQAFACVYRTLEAFLCGLHVSRRVYPIAYDKWIREQVVENLGLPDLYPRLVRLLEVQKLESNELVDKADDLRALVDEYIVD